MLRKLLFAAALLAANSSFALSKGTPYLGFAVGDQNAQSYNGLYGNLFGGYGITAGSKHKLYLAGELFADTGSLPLSHKHHHRTTYGFGASLLPGFVINEATIAYARVGIASFRYDKHNYWRTGGQLGIGLQTQISEKWDVRGEYVYMGKGIIHNFGTCRFNFFDLGLVYKLN